jgi:hypothetical protein
MKLNHTISSSLLNLPGFRTKRKIVVFESDDWGSIRMPSHEIYQQLLKKDIRVDNLAFTKYDSLASEKDLTLLFEVLNSVRDKNGNPAIITANTIVANPDFEKIKSSGFRDYYYEPFTETLKRYPEHARSFELWKEGIEMRVLRPQFHGREHLNVTAWMKALREDKGKAKLAFDYEMFDLSESDNVNENTFVEALDLQNKDELEFQKESIITGLKLFEKLFGYKSKTFVAPCYIWSSELNKTLYESGIKAFQGNWFQFDPIEGTERKFKKRFHFLGQKNSNNQIYMVRNAAFEPTSEPHFDWITEVIEKMQLLFRLGKPVIINTHRINFIGFIDPINREKNLQLFKVLLNCMLNKWPEIEFMSSDQLTDLIS